jgi:hypothetical protein
MNGMFDLGFPCCGESHVALERDEKRLIEPKFENPTV